jgi:hypothetical protein
VWLELAGTRVGIVLWGGLAVIDVTRIAGVPPYGALGALAVLVTMTSAGTRTAVAVSGGVVGWLLVDGFVEHRYGLLGFDASRDPFVLALLVGLAAGAARCTRPDGRPR